MLGGKFEVTMILACPCMGNDKKEFQQAYEPSFNIKGADIGDLQWSHNIESSFLNIVMVLNLHDG